MKKLKDILNEAVSDNARNKALAPYRRKAKAALSPEAASYVGLLEILVSKLGDTAKETDKTFVDFVQRHAQHEKLMASLVTKENLPLDDDEVEDKLDISPEDDKPTKPLMGDEPEVDDLFNRAPGKEPIPSLSTLAAREKEMAASEDKPEKSSEKPPELSKKSDQKEPKGLKKLAGLLKKSAGEKSKVK